MDEEAWSPRRRARHGRVSQLNKISGQLEQEAGGCFLKGFLTEGTLLTTTQYVDQENEKLEFF